jgi:5-methylcytosine-specific restriction endonuclease McrA
MDISPSRSMIYKRDNNTCQYCGARSKLTIDHIVPRSRGGDDSWENLVVACSSCNTKKEYAFGTYGNEINAKTKSPTKQNNF